MNGKPRVVAVIPARGGSKGIPRKNIKPLAGKPLIAYAIEPALASNLIDRVIVSTEDQEIAEVARKYGAEVPFLRPQELADDESPELLTWRHAIRELESQTGSLPMDVFVCLSPTAPLRAVEDIDACIQTLLDSDADLVITIRPPQRNPYFNMVAMDHEGYARIVIPQPKGVERRQDAPAVYDMTTVAYAARPAFVLNVDWLFDGKVKTVLVPSERAVDIDTELDFAFAEYLLTRHQSEKAEMSDGTPAFIPKRSG
jgi:CMP-N-acetylneuraminic acid synthetase